ncbi:MAG: DUF3021 domain-containing protein [Lachnospiraceae bacterium]|nr:DUF3021 domain-containing protein [Lachnospiraceae bacterium]
MKIVKLFLKGIAWGCTVSVFVIMFGSAIVGDTFLAKTSEEFIRQFLAAMIVGIGFVVPTLIYDNRNLSRWVQILIHMGIGFIVYFPIAVHLGWIPTNLGLKMTVLSVLIAIISTFVILLVHFIYYKYEADKMNQKIDHLNQ